MRTEVLDPRFDAEPEYWAELRVSAGLRGDWAWEVLAQQAWCARTPWLVTVLFDGERPRGMVHAAWVGTQSRRHRFARSVRGGRVGALDLRAPGGGTFASWWFADTDDGGCSALVDEYLPLMRRTLGPGLKGALVRQLPESGVAAMRGRFRVVRETEPIASIRTDGYRHRDEWLASLPKKRRAHVNKVCSAVDDGSLDIDLVPGSLVDPVPVAELLRVNEVKHRDVPIVPLPQFTGYLERLLAQPDVLVLRYRDRVEGRLLGVATVYDHPEWPLARSWSSRPVEDGGRQDLYFHLYSELVRWSIDSGRTGVVLGKKMAKVKQSLGAELQPQYAAMLPLR